MSNYKIDFDFTTVTKNGRFTGRSGYLTLNTKATIEQLSMDHDSLQKVCTEFVRSSKPRWNILMITIKNIIKVSTNDQQ